MLPARLDRCSGYYSVDARPDPGLECELTMKLFYRSLSGYVSFVLLSTGIAGLNALPGSGLVAIEGAGGAEQQPDDPPPLKGQYVKKGNRADTIRATLAAFGLPNLEGDWYHIGPFDNTDNNGFDTPYPPEKKFDPSAVYLGKQNVRVRWQKLDSFVPGRLFDIRRLYPQQSTNAVAYFYHRFDSPRSFRLPVSLGSDDT
ncbi:MAG: hypothetical protein NZ703_05475, partial [Gemmataceae bacterium]|nr:hypothetical protein [Gemmataceae bacterium]